MARPFQARWCDAVAGTEFPASTKAVAWRMASYADPDGSSVHPGNTRLARETSLSPATVKRATSTLRDAGFLTTVERGGRRGDGRRDSTVYRLTIPPGLMGEPLSSDLQGSPENSLGLTSRALQGSPMSPHQPIDQPRDHNPPNPPSQGGRRRQRRTVVLDAHRDHWASGGGFSADDGGPRPSSKPEASSPGAGESQNHQVGERTPPNAAWKAARATLENRQDAPPWAADG